MDIVTSCYAKLLHLAMLAIRTCESAAAKECVWHARVSSAQRPALHPLYCSNQTFEAVRRRSEAFLGAPGRRARQTKDVGATS